MKLPSVTQLKRLLNLKQQYDAELERREPHREFLAKSDVVMDRLWKKIRWNEKMIQSDVHPNP